jgi:hypothetical protein
MFTPERIPELQGTGELPGSNQKSRPIDLPFVFYFPHFVPPLGEGISLGIGCKQNAVFLGWIFCEGERNLRVIGGAVNVIFLCNSRIALLEFFRELLNGGISGESRLER